MLSIVNKPTRDFAWQTSKNTKIRNCKANHEQHLVFFIKQIIKYYCYNLSIWYRIDQ